MPCPRDNGSPRGASTDRELSADVTTPQKCCASSINSLQDVQVPRLTSTGGRPCAHDYDDITKEYIVAACTLFCVKISALQGFPDLSQELSMARKVWHKVGEQLNCSLHLVAHIAKLITVCGAQLHGELKTKAWPLVETFFGFDSGNHESALRSNCSMAQYLKKDSHFTYKEDIHTGIYHSKVIQKIVNVMWFCNKQDEGVRFTEYFEPFPLQALALVLTVIKNCIDEWVSGTHVSIDFCGKEYSVGSKNWKTSISIPRSMIYSTKSWLRFIIGAGMFLPFYTIAHYTKLVSHRFHARAIPVSRLDLPKIPYGAFEVAMKEYKEDDNTKTDGERGDSD
ncbi:hypothetical protein L208DRAFT_1293333 [Tricholoma matsutake]|nr:hypothetical protein L208DRAFT_1293333 [Tricholoma matsutake 945]